MYEVTFRLSSRKPPVVEDNVSSAETKTLYFTLCNFKYLKNNTATYPTVATYPTRNKCRTKPNKPMLLDYCCGKYFCEEWEIRKLTLLF